MKIFSKTDIGLVRSANQDSLTTGALEGNAAFAVVCDGMGGAKAGNVASEIAVKCISEYIIKSYRTGMTDDDTEKILKNAVKSANIELYDLSVNNADFSGMGTTVVSAIVKSGKAFIAHVGDSRIYLVNTGLIQLTRDHSVVQTLIESGKISPEDAKVHPRKNVITRALGAEEDVTVDSASIGMNEGDTLLLCTDGLTNYLDADAILKIFENTDISQTADELVKAANSCGGGDNITVVTVTA